MSFCSTGQSPLIAQSQVSDAFNPIEALQPVENGGLFSKE